jgi:hypothetical protein
MSDLTKEERFDGFLQHCKALIKTHGYLLQGVDAGRTWPYAYSAGRSNSDLPDFIVFGFTGYASVIKEAISKNALADEVITSDILTMLNPTDGKSVKTRYVLKRIEQAAFSKYAYAAFNPKLVSKPPVEIYQIFLSDQNNLLPGEPGHEDDEQPRLWTL